MKRHNAVIVLEALLMELSIRDGNADWTLDEDNEFCLIVPNDKSVQLKTHISLRKFIEMTESMSEKDIDLIVMNIGLNADRAITS